MKYVVDYIDANQGGIYVINDDDENNIYYELIASVAYGREKALDNKIKEGEGLVGRCVFEKEPIVLTEIPQDYVRITSGLGTVNPDSILIVPIILNDIVYGVLEFASFGKMEDYKVSFVRKISDVIASAISNHKVSERTAVLLDRAQSQSEALTLQEEQMRQNIEEMKATQEEQEQLQLKLNLRITEMQMVIDSIPYSIIVVDSHGGLRLFNSAFCNMSHYKKEELDVKKVDVLFGSDISIILQKKQFKGELLIKNGSPIKIIIESSIIDTEKKIFLLKITEA
jgi:methyl-accepting chemotaxis protein